MYPWELIPIDGFQAVRLRAGRVAGSVLEVLVKPLSESIHALHLGAVSRLVFLCGAQPMTGLKGLCEVLQLPPSIFHPHWTTDVKWLQSNGLNESILGGQQEAAHSLMYSASSLGGRDDKPSRDRLGVGIMWCQGSCEIWKPTLAAKSENVPAHNGI